MVTVGQALLLQLRVAVMVSESDGYGNGQAGRHSGSAATCMSDSLVLQGASAAEQQCNNRVAKV
jgi:hypothetical protein